MSEDDAPQKDEKAPPKKKLPLMAILVVVGIIVLEGGTIGVMSMLSGPKTVQGLETDKPKVPVYVEIDLYQGRVPNSRTGKKVVLELEIYAKVRQEYEKDVKDARDKHKAELAHRLRTLVGQLDQKELYNTANPNVLQRQVHTLYETYAKGSTEDEVDRIKEIFFKKYNPMDVGY